MFNLILPEETEAATVSDEQLHVQKIESRGATCDYKYYSGNMRKEWRRNTQRDSKTITSSFDLMSPPDEKLTECAQSCLVHLRCAMFAKF